MTECFDADGDGFESPGDPICPGGPESDCDDADPARFPGNQELCNGIDDDCDLLVDNPPVPGPMADLTVDEATLFWNALPDPAGYDVVRGDVTILHESGGDFLSATSQCLADDLQAPTLLEPATPPASQGFWFLVRGVNCGGIGTYDSGFLSQAGARDQEVDSSPDSCP